MGCLFPGDSAFGRGEPLTVVRWATGLLLCLGVLSGCALGVRPPAQPEGHSIAGPDYESHSFQELSAYLGYLARLPMPQRRSECEWLQRYDSIDEGLGVRLHLALALLATPDCGGGQGEEIRQALVLLDQALPRISDPEVRDYLLYHRQMAQRLFSSTHHERKVVRKLTQLRRTARKLNRQLSDCRQESQELNAKLEALKALEDSLNHHGIP